MILWIRNKLFDVGIKKITQVDTKVISVGNLSVGGTGKSPHVQWIADQLKSKFNVAVLSRGYGRTSKGFVKVNVNSKAQTVGDEALFYKDRFKDDVEVAVCEKRVEGAERLLLQHPNLDSIILDDAYQHRYILRDLNILLTDYSNPYYEDFVLPTGDLREFSSGRKRADIVVVTKCPEDLSGEKKDIITQKLNVGNSTEVFFSSIVYGQFVSFGSKAEFDLPERILLVTGIANPKPLEIHLSKIAKVDTLSFKDHHDFTGDDIKRIHNLFDTFAEQNKCIVTTSKDYIRLKNSVHESQVKKYPWFYQDITISIDREEEFLKKIEEHVRKDK
tara:strand:- start:60748 stop:61740 length:993 start_codon:yes stop_codon:yes gene_type:complete